MIVAVRIRLDAEISSLFRVEVDGFVFFPHESNICGWLVELNRLRSWSRGSRMRRPFHTHHVTRCGPHGLGQFHAVDPEESSDLAPHMSDGVLILAFEAPSTGLFVQASKLIVRLQRPDDFLLD